MRAGRWSETPTLGCDGRNGQAVCVGRRSKTPTFGLMDHHRLQPAVFKLVVAFILVVQAAFRKFLFSVGLGVWGLRWTSLTGCQLRAVADHRFGLACRAAA